MHPSIMASLKRFLRREDGPTSVEYAVMIMLIFLAVIVAVQSIGISLSENMLNSARRIREAVGN